MAITSHTLRRFILPTLLLLYLIVGAACHTVAAEESRVELPTETSAQALHPGEVEVGVWLSGLHSIDFVNGSFTAELYIWWISENRDFQPFDTLQVLNGRDWTSRAVYSQELEDGRHYVAGFLSTMVGHDWDLLYYPFDRQTLDIVIETAYTSEQLRFRPQSGRSIVGEFVDVEGFVVEDLIVSESVASYATDFGLESSAGSKYSRLVIKIIAERESGRLIIAILVGFIVANIIALLTFAIDISQLGIRVSMVGSAIFAAIGNMYLLNSQMSPAVGSIIVDRFAVGTFSTILIALLCSIITNALLGKNNTIVALWTNRIVCLLLLVSAGAFYASTLLLAIQSN